MGASERINVTGSNPVSGFRAGLAQLVERPSYLVRMVELAYTADLKSAAFGIVGSSPTAHTKQW